MSKLVYKILTGEQHESFVRSGAFAGSADDLRDGFVHLSAAGQVAATVDKYFREADELMLVALRSEAIDADLRWEVSRGGAKFPHLYAPLTMSAVAWSEPITRDAQGGLRLPSRLATDAPE